MSRWEPMNFYSSAEDYYQSAICIMQAQELGNLNPHFRMSVPYYLFSHAVELALKGFLRTKGLSKNDLKNKYNHKFLKLITDSISYGLPLDKVEHDTAIKWLEEYNREAFNFRYVRSGLISLTDIKSTKANVERILSVVRPACEKARDRAEANEKIEKLARHRGHKPKARKRG
jgi:hypothetical protein